MDKTITIAISGPPCSGKSTVAYHLESIFRMYGFPVEHEETELNVTAVVNKITNALDHLHAMKAAGVNFVIIDGRQTLREVCHKNKKARRKVS